MLLMASYLDSVPLSGIIRIRDMMYAVDRPFRLDQGDVSFDAPDTVKAALAQGIVENRSHYVQTTGIPALVALIAEKLRTKNGIPIGADDEVMVTTGGVHGLFTVCQGLFEPGDEVLLPDPTLAARRRQHRGRPRRAGALPAARLAGLAARCG